MSIEPASNGIESLTAVEGLRVVNTGRNRFTIGLNVLYEEEYANPLQDEAIPAGFSEEELASDSRLSYTGPYIITFRYRAGTGPGAIVAGPDDRLMFFVNIVSPELPQGKTAVAIPIPIYNRNIADIIPQAFTGMGLFENRVGDIVNTSLGYFNVSGTLTIPTAVIAYELYPLTSIEGPADAAPAPIRMARR